MKKQSTKQKGAKLEKQFAKFLIEKLKYKEAKLNEMVKGKDSINAY